MDQSFSWLSEEWTRTELELAEEKKDPALIAPLLIERSKQVPLREEKVKLILRAQKLGASVEERLYLIAPRFNKNFKPAQSLVIAKDFLRAREFNSAKRIYLNVLNKKNFSLKEKMAAFRDLARLEKLNRDRDEHIEILKMYAKFLKRSFNNKKNRKFRSVILKQIKDNEIELARALWTVGKRSEAEKILHARVNKKKKLFSYAVHYWLLGRIEEEKKNSDEALNWLRLSVKEVQDDSELESQARWFLAWNLYKLNHYEEAIEHLTWFQNSEAEDFTKARAAYWSGVSLDKLGKKDESKKVFQSLSEFDPLGYYGLLARRELGENLRKPKTSDSSSDSYFFRMKLRDVYQPEWVEWMIAMHEKEALKNYLSQVTGDYLREKDQDEGVWLALLKSYARAGEYLGLFQKLYSLKPETRDRLLMDHPELLFPTPHLEEVKKASEKFQVEPELIYSIIRQESAFNPEARSPADAFGLMQLLPKVAKRFGDKIGVEVDHYTDLYLPEKNIPIGAYFVAQQLKRYDNHFISTVASYNASDRAVRGWFQSRARPSSVEFIEEIPYEETKSYVRLLIRNFTFYRLFLSPQSEIPFPEELLTSKE